MSWDTTPDAELAPQGDGKGKGGSTAIGRESVRALGREQPFVTARPDAKSFLPLSQSLGTLARDDPRVITALEAYLEARRAGRPWSRADFLAQHPAIAETLEQCLSGLEFIEEVAPQLAGSQPFVAANPAAVIPPQAQLGDYRILREIGRGGMGVVYEAEQVSLGRHVALKVLPFAAAIDPKQRQRFQIEAQAAAQLHHPHIVPIFGVGCDHGIHYYAMQYVDGRSLAAIIHELRSCHEAPSGAQQLSGSAALKTEEAPSSTIGMTRDVSSSAEVAKTLDAAPEELTLAGVRPDSAPSSGLDSTGESLASTSIGLMHRDRAFCRNVARLGIEAADALEHAHSLGIVHRDIKPANLLIDRYGALWITDFGLARFATDLSLTHTGDMVGTLRYMSPEQAQATGGVVDQRADIYALGVTLYELLTLRPAFDGRDHQELLRQIALDEPVSPRRLNPAVPRDLETIVLKAIAKDPSSRYTTAQEVGADLKRFLDDQPILARRPGSVERTLRWARRHRDLVATTAVILMLAFIVGTAATWAQARKTWAQALKTEDALRRRNAFIIESYPLLDRVGTGAIGDAGKLLQGPAGPATEEGATQIFEQALSIFKQAIELPPNDLKSREVIARAYSRLGQTRWMLSMAKAAKDGDGPQLLNNALLDFRQSIALLEKLLADSPDDPKIRRYLAEALGLGGMGCCLRSALRPEEAEPLYRRTIEIRRELLCGIGAGGTTKVQAQADLAGELNDLSYLVNTVHLVARMLDDKGHLAEAEALRRQLEGDIVAVAARLSRPEFQQRRRMLAGQLAVGQFPTFDQSWRRDAMINYRLALILDPENAHANNNLAWSLVSVPGDPWFDPTQGRALAQKAVALEPNEWQFLNTLGVATFRAGDWKTATEVLQQSITFTGGGAHDLFFLAMTYWYRGSKKEAQVFYDRAVSWTNKHKPDDPELRRFRAEATALLSQPCQKPTKHHGERQDNFTETTAKKQPPA